MRRAPTCARGNLSRPVTEDQPASPTFPKRLLPLALGALGVVYGDIGTSPLYAIKECFHGTHAIALSENSIFGVLSLVFWSLTVVVSIKYVVFILKADNRGEGGIFALLALILRDKKHLTPRLHAVLVFSGIFGAALLYGDAVITPAISVLSAVEGLEVATKAAQPLVLPITCAILLLLFLVQRRGTADIGTVFGPVMLIWFGVIAALGVKEIATNPRILFALSPRYAYEFFLVNRWHGIVVLGSVVLCITGAEALYADLGHFGLSAIRLSWLGLAFPALLLNYFGQGALLLENPQLAFNPFYGMVPKYLLYPMVGLATMATVIASQAMISGVFSLTQQAVQLGYCPRVRIVHTSSETEGQIYISSVNVALVLACLGVVLAFRESSRLAGAYGIAVTATMGFTSVLYFFVVSKTWRWSLGKTIPLLGLFLAFDVTYFGANLLKVVDGGWFTLVVATLIMTAMTTWKDGRSELSRKMLSTRLPLEILLQNLAEHPLQRVYGTAVFMTVSPLGTPSALLHQVKHNHVLHEKVVLLSIRTVDTPVVPMDERLKVENLGQGCYRFLALYGFMEKPDVPTVMKLAPRFDIEIDPATTTYFLGREVLLTSGDSSMMRWRKSLFAFMSRNAQTATVFFGIPVDRVIEIGVQIEF